MVLKSLRSIPAMHHGFTGVVRHIARLSHPGTTEAAISGQILALPAEITKRVGRFRQTP